MDNIYKLADNVSDERSFLDFLIKLSEDKKLENALELETPSSPYASGALGWENGSIEAFLERAAAWGKSYVYTEKKPENVWARVAHIIHAGKFYE